MKTTAWYNLVEVTDVFFIENTGDKLSRQLLSLVDFSRGNNYYSDGIRVAILSDVMFYLLNNKKKVMYEAKMMAEQSNVLPEHLEIAQRFSNEMMDRFNPEEVNEILHYIRQMFKERREMDIAEAQKKLAYLQKTIEDL